VLVAESAGKAFIVSGAPPKIVTVEGLNRPHDAALAPSGQIALTETGTHDLTLVDGTTGRIEKRVPLAGRPHDVAWDGTSSWIVTLPSSRIVSIVDPESGAKPLALPLKERPHSCLGTREQQICVTYDAPHVLSVQNGSVNWEKSAGVFPHHLFSGAPGSVWVTDPNGGKVFQFATDGKINREFSVAKPQRGLQWEGSLYVVSLDGYLQRLTLEGEAQGRWNVPGKPHAVAVIDH